MPMGWGLRNDFVGSSQLRMNANVREYKKEKVGMNN